MILNIVQSQNSSEQLISTMAAQPLYQSAATFPSTPYLFPSQSGTDLWAIGIFVILPPPQHHMSRCATGVLPSLPGNSMYPNSYNSEHVSTAIFP